MLTSEIKSEVNQILEHDVGDLAKWKALCRYFLDKKICYYTTIKVQDMLAHGQNRWQWHFSAQCSCQGPDHFDSRL